MILPPIAAPYLPPYCKVIAGESKIIGVKDRGNVDRYYDVIGLDVTQLPGWKNRRRIDERQRHALRKDRDEIGLSKGFGVWPDEPKPLPENPPLVRFRLILKAKAPSWTVRST